ncbi:MULTISPECIES: hypothetical protein [unclassified Burkholderia]|uniref:hypothetical protein n=1 Tax=unclassified Burkholderia TaxID=2613784 RepID=UPI001420DE93|nr:MULTISPECIES: hypothetical protein [unclassified Burkholderia]NIE81958.1 hypothetical protein [Burkholderia sp. Tr-860]NIF61742.1 hypothetical protein [Burkholderia sp. Cy-647]NIF94049.1 hypothetical protein [Burkholderia sp. Ax-1720]
MNISEAKFESVVQTMVALLEAKFSDVTIITKSGDQAPFCLPIVTAWDALRGALAASGISVGGEERVFNVSANKGRNYVVTLGASYTPRVVQSKVCRDLGTPYLRTIWTAESGKAMSLHVACAVRAAVAMAEQQ